MKEINRYNLFIESILDVRVYIRKRTRIAHPIAVNSTRALQCVSNEEERIKSKYQNEIHLHSARDSVFSIVDDPTTVFFNRQQN